jgi:hypothetical protein
MNGEVSEIASSCYGVGGQGLNVARSNGVWVRARPGMRKLFARLRERCTVTRSMTGKGTTRARERLAGAAARGSLL